MANSTVMYNISLIFTRHEPSGNCNSEELYRIIQLINPEIIFEELSESNFYRSYNENNLFTVETSAIKLYLLGHNIEHIPVDTFDRPKYYDEEVNNLYRKLLRNNSIIECQKLRCISDRQLSLSTQQGFGFLNSDQNDKLFDEFNALKKEVLEILNDEDLFRIHKMEMEVIDKRENEILNNVYRYSKQYPYKQGLLFIGSGHRAAMIRKIEEYNAKENLKLNWTIHTT